MSVIYFKRYRMRIDLREKQFDEFEIPPGYHFHPWSHRLLNAHAEAKFRSFRQELDANVFPCLADADGCIRLMKEISCRQGFVPESTWLVTFEDPDTGRHENCGTVQGISEKVDVGSIQNIGIVTGHRGTGIGSLIVLHSLRGFRSAGIKFVNLEVTAQNTGACRLYHRLGFRTLRTVYKSVEVRNVV
jgi:ribosomal protein S18 acetylase RimI-like enzyme